MTERRESWRWCKKRERGKLSLERKMTEMIISWDFSKQKEDRWPQGCRREFTCRSQGWKLLERNPERKGDWAGSLKTEQKLSNLHIYEQEIGRIFHLGVVGRPVTLEGRQRAESGLVRTVGLI